MAIDWKLTGGEEFGTNQGEGIKMADQGNQERDPLDLLLLKHFHLLDSDAVETPARLRELASPSYRRENNITSLTVERYEGKMPTIDICSAFQGTGYDDLKGMAASRSVFEVYGKNNEGFEYIGGFSVNNTDKKGEFELTLRYIFIDDALKYKVTFASTKKIRLPTERSEGIPTEEI